MTQHTIRIEHSLLADISYEVALVVDPKDPEAFEILWVDEDDGDRPSAFRGRAGRFEGEHFIGIATDKKDPDEEYRVCAHVGYRSDTISGEDLVALVRGYLELHNVSRTVQQRDCYSPTHDDFATVGPCANAERFAREEKRLFGEGGWGLDSDVSESIKFEFDIVGLLEEMVVRHELHG